MTDAGSVPFGAYEASPFENLLRLDTMVIEVVAKVGSGTPVLGTLTCVLVVRLGPMGTLTQVLGGILEDMCCERRRAEASLPITH